jgi:hypothetical protein
MPRKGRSNQEIVHALHQAESGEKVGLTRDRHILQEIVRKSSEASRTLHPGGVGADDLPSEPTPGREAGPPCGSIRGGTPCQRERPSA